MNEKKDIQTVEFIDEEIDAYTSEQPMIAKIEKLIQECKTTDTPAAKFYEECANACLVTAKSSAKLADKKKTLKEVGKVIAEHNQELREAYQKRNML